MTPPRVTEEMVERVENGWLDVVAPIVARFRTAASLNLETEWNTKGCAAMATVIETMARKLDLAVSLQCSSPDIAKIEAAAYERGEVAMRERAAKAADNCYDCYGRNAVADIRALTLKPEERTQ